MVQKNSVNFRPVILIGGATATGKSSLAVEIAKRFNGEIISADSMQIYRGFDIGTAKITKSEMQGVPHHLISFHDGKEYYSVKEFKDNAEFVIKNLLKQGKLPVVVGGTGLYLNSLLFNYQFGGKGKYERGNPEYNFLPIVVEKPRDVLYERINSRVDKMLSAGLLDEIKGLLKNGYSFESIPFRAIGYKEFKGYFEGKQQLEECVDVLKKDSRHYAKRQITWFKQWKNVATEIDGDNQEQAIKLVEEFLKNGNKN